MDAGATERAWRWWLAVNVCAVWVAASGCAGTGEREVDGAEDVVAGGGARDARRLRGVERVDAEDPFEPREVRVHPLTRLQLEPARGVPHIDAHVEFLDGAQDPVKAAGELTFILYSGRRVGQGLQQVASWKVERFADPERNARAFDHVTRTYRFRLEGLPTGLDPQGGLVLEAVLNRGERARISARQTL